MEIKLHTFEARQLHAMGAGLYLYPDELGCDFYPDEQTEVSKQIDKNWIVLHTTGSWASRTWTTENWKTLVRLIKDNTDLKIVIIGRSHREIESNGEMQKDVLRLEGIDLDLCEDGTGYQSQFTSGAISEMWHVINNALALISFDSGPIHLAGTTDSHILQLGSSINPKKTAPWRNGNQNYKFKFIAGECNLLCASDPKYCVREWGTVNCIPYVPLCLEKYNSFRCQPDAYQVFSELLHLISHE